MARLVGTAMMFLLLTGPLPVWAASEITVDFGTGEVTESRDEPVSDAQAPIPAEEELESAAQEIARLKKLVRLQTNLIKKQQAIIREQREENRRLNDINRGLELMLRSCR
jgi:TolA-binding protein